ncbi:conserved Plasmodium protein, unknown function [Plasmodium relictum]|uniref:Uncharacterized protein n=1 Tax=Plasmodium relictum TaxID=85471 RepID=A0A1J1HDH8_PLARL|nr:conserved Plasmodium protein, unknown function [Plasmodium relictum]CRH03955.1 conserved Plasmodium protein, unknown function [Plasmodium relictum]
MNENKKDNKDEVTRSNKISRESLLDDQFSERSSNNLLLCNEKNHDETKFYSRKKINTEKPHIHRNLINNFSTERYKKFLVKIEKSNQDINSMDVESVQIDKDILNPPDDNNKTCVVMDVSMGIFDVCNENLSDSKLKDMNIIISEVIDKVNKIIAF